MANFSDDEQMFEVDSVIDQRKRKGILEYLVQWKGAEAGKDTSWEPAAKIAADCAAAVASFVKSKTKKRSVSRGRKVSRSRSRSSSRARKAKTERVAVRRSTRSRSRGRPKKEVKEETVQKVEEVKPTVEVTEEKTEPEKPVESSESLPPVAQAVESTPQAVEPTPQAVEPTPPEEVPVSQVETVSQVEALSQVETVSQAESVSTVSSTTSVSKTVVTESVTMSEEVVAKPSSSGSDRVLRSAAKKNADLEVQRVHTELRPVHEDDGKPRSCVWKVADYAVIVLFVLSVIAAVFLFAEKFVDLKDFKPSLTTLQARLVSGAQTGIDLFSGAWLSLMDLIGCGGAKSEK